MWIKCQYILQYIDILEEIGIFREWKQNRFTNTNMRKNYAQILDKNKTIL